MVTRQQDYQAEGAVVFHTPEDAVKAGSETGEIFIIGGAELYEYFLQRADALYITHVNSIASADTFFPDFISLKKWSPIFRVHVADEPKATLIKYQMDFSWFTANINKG